MLKFQLSCGMLPKLSLWFIFKIVTINSAVGTLKYDYNFGSFNEQSHLSFNFKAFLPIFSSTSLNCIFSKNKEFLNVFVKTFTKSKTLVFDNFKVINIEGCDNVIALDVNTYFYCSDVFETNFFASVYFVTSLNKTDVKSLENCLRNTSSSDVVLISLQANSVYRLSPMFPRPRHFLVSSVADILKQRVQPMKTNLAGTTLSVPVMYYSPFFFFKDRDKGQFDGIEERLVNEMSKILNFSVNYLIYKSWGTLMTNGTWVGEVGGAMQENRGDLAIANFWQIPSLYAIMDFGPPLSKVSVNFAVRRPTKVKFHWHTVLKILKPRVWLAVFLSFILVVAAYWAGVNWDIHPHTETCGSCVLTVLGHLLMTTSHRRVSDGNTRHTLTSWSIFSLLITTSFSTGIISRLTLPSFTARVDTVKQLVEGHYYWTVDYYNRFKSNKQMREFLFDFENPWVSRFEESFVHLEAEEVLKRASTDHLVTFPVQVNTQDLLILDTPGLMEHKALKNFRLCKEATSQMYISIGVKKKSTLLEPLSVLNLRMVETGLFEHWTDGVLEDWPQYDNSHLQEEEDDVIFEGRHPLTYHQVQPVLSLLLFGILVASLVCVVEVNCNCKPCHRLQRAQASNPF